MYRVYMEAGFKLSEHPATWVQSDVSVVSEERCRATRQGYLSGAPELAVEVISPSESAADIDEKVDLLLEHGSKAVWVIYPKTRKIRIFRADGSARTALPGDLLTEEALGPMTFPPGRLFEG